MKLKDWLRRGAEVQTDVQAEAERKTEALPAVLSPWRPAGIQPDALPKITPVNLRRFAETPAARRAINVVKDRIAAMDWQLRLRRDCRAEDSPDATERMRALRASLENPNPGDSFRSLLEQVLEDTLVGGFGAAEIQLTGDDAQPVELWPVDGASIRVNASWNGSQDSARYAQQTQKPGDAGLVSLRDEELMYVRLNPRTHTPFGLGKLEVAFESVNSFLAAHRYAGKLASNSVVQYALWLNEATPEQHNRLIRWWQDEVEGTGRVPVLSSEQKPEVVKFASGSDADLRLQWQEFLLRMIANAFDLPAFYLGLENDVNKNTAGELADEMFRGAIQPVARLIEEHITRDVIVKRLGWTDIEFAFNNVEQRDEVQEAQMQIDLLKAGVLTVEEVRAMRGLAPVPAGVVEGAF